MKRFTNFDDLPKKLQREISANSYSMQHFYTMPVEKRQHVLDRIRRLNSKQELEDVIE